MSVLGRTESLDQFRLLCYTWPRELTWPKRLGLAVIMAAVTGLSAQVRFPLPDTLVPVTGQVFAVLLSGVLLGGAWGSLSQTIYLGLGAAGLPWFAGWAAGLPTAGYLIGFIPAAMAVGWVTDRHIAARYFLPQVALMIGGVAVIYSFGAFMFSQITGLGPGATIQEAVLPFVPFDLGKVLAAAAISSTLLPKKTGNKVCG